MLHSLQIQKILLAVEEAAYYDDKIKLLKQAINIADVNNDLDWGYDLRLDLIHLEKGTSYCVESFPAFTWLLETIDANPDLFEESSIFMEYKWLVAAAHKNSNFSLEQIVSISNDYKRRLQDNGMGLYTYYVLENSWNIHTGRFDEAYRSKERRNKEQPDAISFCSACLISADAELELASGNFENAIVLADDVLAGRDTCKYEPFHTLCLFTYYLSRANDVRSEKYFSEAEAELSGLVHESYMMMDISYLIFHASIHNKDKAWALFEKYSEWDIMADDYISFYFAANALPLFKEEGSQKLNLNPNLPYFDKSGDYNISSLYDYFYSRADNLAIKFDRRNKNTYFSDTLRLLNSFS